ncbi:TIGR04551 family protein [Sorangium sp. So ce375]|uniref:TIGR04551 family protein n=1 Tax=Sorangium sp. So ce375 TaxID=3133306 RepID=UPI003F5C3549
MPISSRSPGTSCRPGSPRRRLRSGLALALVLGASSASAQPARRPAQPPAAPAQPPAGQAGANAPQPGAAPAQPGAAPVAPAQPGAAQRLQAQPAPAPATPAQPAPAPATPAQPGAAPAGGAAETPAPPAAREPLLPPADTAAPAEPQPATPAASEGPAAAEAAAQPERKAIQAEIGARPSEVYAEDWWSHARPTFEFHGYYRLRWELFNSFALGRVDPRDQALWPQPADNSTTGSVVSLCNPSETTSGGTRSFDACKSNTQAGANMRFRLNPELHISDNLRILTQVDLLDNVVLGSTPDGYTNQPAAGGGYTVARRGGYSPLGAFSSTQWAPSAGVNSTKDSISVKRIWGEYMTPVGLLRFGRMPNHWGLGMVANSGDGHDSDYQSTVDRLMFVTGIKKYDIYFAGAWDWANEGATSASFQDLEGQPYDLAQSDDVDQYVFVAVRRKNPELQKLELARGNMVMNGGVYFAYRQQTLANDITADDANPEWSASLGGSADEIAKGYVHRGAEMIIPDVWFQLLYKKFRFELEAAMIYGSLDLRGQDESDYANVLSPKDNGWGIRQFGLATQAELTEMEGRLRVHFGFGYATGDDDVPSLKPQGQLGAMEPQNSTDRTYSTFRFHPDYRVDQILFRNILSRVQGAYYFRPGVDWDFARDKNGQRAGLGAAAIWSRASEFVQAPGNSRDLGIELNGQLYFQSKDGTLNDDPDKMGGFYTAVQYGVLFPLGGLGQLKGEETVQKIDLETAQTVRWYLGILF